MFGELIPIAFFAMVAFIVWTKHQQRIGEGPAAPQVDDGRTRQLESQVEVLQDRVEVLERIVTDKGYDLASQIEALRDERPLDQRLDSREKERNT